MLTFILISPKLLARYVLLFVISTQPPHMKISSLVSLIWDTTSPTFTTSNAFPTKHPCHYFSSDINNLDIYKIQFLLNTKIVVEKPHPRKGPPQCHLCQIYGHTRSYCHYVPRCVKCGEEHLSVSCNKSKDSPAKCALCSGDHTANFKGCPAYKKLNKNKPKISPKTPPTVFPDAQAKPKARSYAEAAANNNSTADIITTVLSQFITDLNSVIGPLISLLTELSVV
ncbi:hypothetical protein QTP88_017204 [Uroleucon formosanum]